jgi:16S rRNA (cytidine1402-2'-O)-methyltransferase
LEQAAQRALELTRNGYAASAAAKAAAQGTPYSKSEVYKQLLALQAD